MKKFLCLLFSLSLIFTTTLALADDDLVTLSDRSWIASQAYMLACCTSLAGEDENVHLLWDIPFGTTVEEFFTLALNNANIQLCVQNNKSVAYLAVEDPSSITLFGHPLRQSFFGFQTFKQDVGLAAGQASGRADPSYVCAALRLYNGLDDISITEAMDCFKSIFTAMCELYGQPTRTSYLGSDTSWDSDIYAFPVLNEDDSLNESWILSSLEKTADSIGTSEFGVYWSNVELELSRDPFHSVSLYYVPSESIW